MNKHELACLALIIGAKKPVGMWYKRQILKQIAAKKSPVLSGPERAPNGIGKWSEVLYKIPA